MNMARVVKAMPELWAFGGHQGKRRPGREILAPGLPTAPGPSLQPPWAHSFQMARHTQFFPPMLSPQHPRAASREGAVTPQARLGISGTKMNKEEMFSQETDV